MVFEHLKGETLFIPKLILTICGIWPTHRRNIGALIALVISAALKLAYIITQLINLCRHVHLGIYTMQLLIFFIGGVVSGLSIRMNSGRILRLIESKTNSWLSITNLKDRMIMKNNKIFGTSFFVVSIPVYFVIPYVLETMYFPYDLDDKLSVDKQKALNDYDIIWVTMTAILRMVVFFQLTLEEYGVEMLFWNLNMHLAKEFKILKTRFQKHLRIKCKERSREVFRRLVDRHNELLELSDDLKNSFFVPLTVLVFVCQMYICGEAHRLAIGINNDNFMEIVVRSFNIAICLWLLLILYNSGEFLTTCSEEIADVFYQCKWYNLSKESRNNFAMVILRCRRPVTFTVGGFFKLNHSNYRYLVKAVYSYISLILAITSKD